jgi:PAS domain S-box-containing protein
MTGDIDESKLKSSEQGLRESDDNLQKVIDTIPSHLWSADPAGELSQFSQRALDYHGVQLGDLKHGGWEKYVHPDDHPETARAFYQAIQTGASYEAVHRLRRSDGEYRWHHARGEPLHDREGQIVQWYGLSIDIDDRMKAEEALRESEHKLRQIIDTVPGFLWSVDPAGESTHVNQHSLDYYGRRFEDFKNRGWEGCVHPADLPATAKAYDHAFQTGTPYDDVMRLRRADGEFRWHHARCEPLRDRQGRVIQWYGVSIDIDERKKAEDLLRRNEAYLADAQRLSHTGSGAYNDTAILYLSDETYRIFGFNPSEGLPSREAVLERIHPDDRERVREEVRKGMDQKKEYKLEYKILLANGTIKFIESNAHPKFSASGEFVEVVTTIVDVTERKRAEQALRESEQNLRSAVDGIPGLVAVLAPNGEVETANRPLFEYFGQSLEWLKNWGTNDAVHPEDLPRVAKIFRRAVASGLRFHFEQRLRCIDGEYRWFENRGVPIRDDSGRITRWYVLLTDIEERTRALAQLEQMQSDFAHMNRVSTMGELAAELSHEITQPIASARNNARAAQNFLDQRPPNLGEIRQALRCVVGDTDRAGDIIDRIRDHIKKAPPRKAHFDLNEAINEVILLGRGAITANSVSVQTRLSKELFPVDGDRVQLQQVVLNLLLNAVEAMGSVEGEPRELLISTEQQHTGVLVAVRDSGPGIDPTRLQRVFDAFHTTKPRGTGMGLSICRSIVDAHGGRLWAEAIEPRGIVFQFTLPAVQSLTEA